MTRDVKVSLLDILENMGKALGFLGSKPYEEFLQDELTKYAIVRCLEIVGEAAKNVPAQIRMKRPEVSWRDLAGLRDKCIHMYFGINYRRVWQVLKEDIPRLQPAILSLLQELEEESGGHT